MAALTADRLTPINKQVAGAESGYTIDMPMTASITLYKGAWVENVTATGLIKSALAADTATIAGYVEQQKTSAATGTTLCPVRVGALVEVPVPSVAVTSVGAIVYASDDQTLTLTAATNIPVGRIQKVISTTSTMCVVQTSLYVGQTL